MSSPGLQVASGRMAIGSKYSLKRLRREVDEIAKQGVSIMLVEEGKLVRFTNIWGHSWQTPKMSVEEAKYFLWGFGVGREK